MATPKVFVSSTCFDLSEVRDQLMRFITSFGFDPVLSEYGDIFYHPDLHTHESCIREVSNCQMLILLIGGRFGGSYVADKSKSITNAEYIAAKNSGIPVFTYIRSSVMSNHFVFRENKKKPFSNEINYPAIEKQEHAVDIFNFIDEIRRSNSGNAFEGFDSFSDIEFHLRKQWAGMFFDFLKTREVKNQIDATNHLLAGISSSNQKLEEIIKSLYVTINENDANRGISLAEVRSHTESFYMDVFINKTVRREGVAGNIVLGGKKVEELAAVDPTNMQWAEYLVALGLFEHNKVIFRNLEKEGSSKVIQISAIKHTSGYWNIITNRKYTPNTSLYDRRIKCFEEGILKSTPEIRLQSLQSIVQLMPDDQDA